MSTQSSLGSHLHAYFENYLRCQKGVRPGTIGSYRDTMRLFLQFVAADRRCKLTRLRLSDFTCDRVLMFLNHLETQRGNAVATRNQRLAPSCPLTWQRGQVAHLSALAANRFVAE